VLPQPGFGALQVALAFGTALTVATYSLEHVSGAHFNPIVTVGNAIANRFPIRDLVPYSHPGHAPPGALHRADRLEPFPIRESSWQQQAPPQSAPAERVARGRAP